MEDTNSKAGARGMAEVFLGEDQLLGCPVAVKVLFPEFASDPSLSSASEEKPSTANLSHPNIVGVLTGERKKTVHSVEYVEGRTLSQTVPKRPITGPRVVEIADAIASAVGFAHKGNVVHRDMKPAM